MLSRAIVCCFVVASAVVAVAEEPTKRPYRLEEVELKQPIIWSYTCRPEGTPALAFGGQDQDAEDARPHTRLEIDGKLTPIHAELRKNNPLQAYQAQIIELRDQAKVLATVSRRIYLTDKVSDRKTQQGQAEVTGIVAGGIDRLVKLLGTQQDSEYIPRQEEFARKHLTRARDLIASEEPTLNAASIKRLHQAIVEMELAAEAVDAEPAARALDCGTRRKSDEPSQRAAIVFIPSTRQYVLFGGDHLDYLTNDTWVFDLDDRQWRQLHPSGAPPPRANHHLSLDDDGRLRLTGGYTYSSNPEYIGGQYRDLDDGPWFFDVKTAQWTAADGSDTGLVASDSRTYRTGAFHPDYYLEGDPPDAKAFSAWLAKLKPNTWTATNPPHLPRLNRDWGTARFDPDRDLMLRWSGGHSAHGGTDVPHFHFATNRWELPSAVEFPLGQLYSNTSYPRGYSFNLRPWITGHTYQSYAYDPPSKRMVSVGQPDYYYMYHPDLGDWTGRGEKPKAMQYNSCFYTLTLTATPRGAVCWDRYGRVHRFNTAIKAFTTTRAWVELRINGDKLPGAHVDNSSIVYDKNRDRVLMINSDGYGKPYSGEVWALDLKSSRVSALSPDGREHAERFANIDKTCFDPANDLLLVSTYLKDAGDHTPTPVYDCRQNRWITLDLAYETGTRLKRITRAFPYNRSAGVMYDPARNLIWGTDTNGQVYVLRLDLETAGVKPLE